MRFWLCFFCLGVAVSGVFAQSTVNTAAYDDAATYRDFRTGDFSLEQMRKKSGGGGIGGMLPRVLFVTPTL